MTITNALAAAAVLALGTASFLGRGRQEERRDDARPAMLVASGEAEVAAAPDRAVVQLGAEAETPSAAAAQQQVNQAMQQAIAAIREGGVPAEDVQTASISLHPVYSDSRPQRRAEGGAEEPRIVAYRASSTVRVEVDDPAALGDVIDRGVAAGANQLAGLSFELRDDTPQRAEALRRAVDSARRKAEALAHAAGVRLVSVHRVEEGGVRTMASVQRLQAASFEAGTPIQPGQVRVSAAVTITWRIAPVDTGGGSEER